MRLNLDKSLWKRVGLGEVVRNRNDYFDPRENDALPYVAGPHIDRGCLSIRRYGLTTDDKFPPTFKRLFRSGDVLLHSRGIEKIGVVDRSGVTGEKLFVLRVADPKVLDQRFLPWLISSPVAGAYFRANFSGSVNKFLNWRPLAAMEIELPPLDEQKRLADLLWAVEADRRARLALLEAAQEAEVGLLRDGFSFHWPRSTVSELGDVQLGQQLHPKYRTGPRMRPYLRVANVADNRLDLADVASMDFSDRGADRFLLKFGDVLLNEGQSIELVGRCAMFRDEIPECYMQKTLLRFRAGPDILPEFALAWFRRCFHLGDFAAVAKKTTSMAHLTAVRFSAMPMPCPSRTEQRALVELVKSVEVTLAEIRKGIRANQCVRAALLAETFGDN
ncbi:hypothetical protein [Micromonospora echinospora]|uniref:restriction endonuclease subunit S n=1 Tax=Micromonospora echinospora TaxID=1877 RepID=UPI003A8BD86C